MNNNVMVVDDDAAARDLLVLHLTKNRFKAVAAAGGEECLEHFKNGFNGVVLLDVRMPGMDGWKTIKENPEWNSSNSKADLIIKELEELKIKTNKFKTSILSQDIQLLIDDFKKYVVEYIAKPVDLKQLVTTIRNYLRYF